MCFSQVVWECRYLWDCFDYCCILNILLFYFFFSVVDLLVFDLDNEIGLVRVI